jgi:polyhydroxyalkanoate synthesis repressor PhaR
MSKTDKDDAVIIKKYANRRLYDTSASKYVTLDHLRELVKVGRDFKVVDAKSGEDLTRGVLAQIIFEEESKGETLLPVEFLRQLIGFYGDSMQSMVPSYLRLSMDSLAQQHAEMREKMSGAMGSPAASMQMMEEATKRNMAMFEQAMKMFTPFGAAGEAGGGPSGGSTAAGRRPEGESADMAELRAELDAMRQRLDKLAGGDS